MSMREKMAAAMSEAYVLHALESLGDETALKLVDAALDALESPTRAMAEAAFGCCDSSGERATFIKMISAAKDGK